MRPLFLAIALLLAAPAHADPRVATIPKAPLIERARDSQRLSFDLLFENPGFEEGLPAYFEQVRVRNGRGWSAPYDGPVDSGDVVEAKP
jgi:hypothetical protein